jgi:hypothetical protein
METIQTILHTAWQLAMLAGIIWAILLMAQINVNHTEIMKKQDTLIVSYERWMKELMGRTRPANRKGHVVLSITDRGKLADTTRGK